MIRPKAIKTVAYITVIVIGCGWLLYIGRGLIMPLLFALIFAIFLMPINKFYGKKIKIRWLTILLAFLTVIIPILGLFTLFSFQLVDMAENLPNIADQVEKGINRIFVTINSWNPYQDVDAQSLIKENIDTITSGPLSSLRSGIISTSEVVLSGALSFLYAFFILYYKESFKNFVIYQYARYKRSDIRDTLLSIKETVQGYITGLGIVIVILSITNSIGLYLIGIDYPIFWGCLAGILAVIPYIGTLLGGALPFLYSLSTTDTTWQPIAIVLFYAAVQQIEGNFITPNVVGNKVNINPFVSIVALIFFGTFWGIGGVILALPLVSVIRIIFGQFDETRPISMLMSADIRKNASEFKKLISKRDHPHVILPTDKGYTDPAK